MVRKRNQVAEVDWSEYFMSIQSVCPWSIQAFQHNLIDITTWQGQAKPLDSKLARIYICKLNSRRLKKLATKLENQDLESEWLWSHPCFREYSTPMPCLIQQNRQHLARIRANQVVKIHNFSRQNK